MSEPLELHDRAATVGPPDAAAPPEPWSHPWHDQLGLLYHRAIAEKLRAQPGLRRVALENLARWTARNDYPPSVLRAFADWRALLTAVPIEPLLTALTDPSERGHARRQNTPFAGLLTPEERRQIRTAHETAPTH